MSQTDCSGAACLCCLPGLPSLCLPSLPLRSCGLGPVAWTSVTGRQVSGPILLVLALVRGQPARCVWRRIVFRDVVKLQVRQKPGLVSASHLRLRWHMLLSFPSELDTRMLSFPSFPPWCIPFPPSLPGASRSVCLFLCLTSRGLFSTTARNRKKARRELLRSPRLMGGLTRGRVRTFSRVEGSR